MRAVNLLPEEFRPRQPAGDARGAHIVLGVLGALLVMALAYAVTANQVNSRKTEVATAEAEAEQAEAKARAGGSFTDFRRIKETRLASVKELAQVRFDWERLLRELALVMPEDTWILDMNASTTSTDASSPGGAADSSSPTPSTSSPSASAPAGGAAAAGAISPTLHISGCALKQPDVAVLMVRLRKLHRVTDVQLGESMQEEDEGASAGGGDSASENTDGCGGKRFKFDMTVTFFPMDPDSVKPLRVPASLGGGS
jgi:hypothetical protein